MATERCVDPVALEKLAQVGGAAFDVQIIDLLLNYVPQKLAEARAAEEASNRLGVGQAVHPIKSSACHLGACAVRALSLRIEALASDPEGESVAGLLAELDAAYVLVKSRLEQHRETLAAQEGTETGEVS